MAVTYADAARRPFRILAALVAVVCFVLAAVAGFGPVDDGLLAAGVFVFVGFVMVAIAGTGHWPPGPARTGTTRSEDRWSPASALEAGLLFEGTGEARLRSQKPGY